MKDIRKILIANRGEIACRVIRTCRKLGIRTVAVFSDADRDAPHVYQADEAVHIGASQATESYLCIDKLIDAAKLTQADAIHPGYGFLSENADFSRACFENGIKFIGPAAESILAVGDKIGAKNLLTAKAPHIPLVPGYNGDDQSMEVLVRESIRIGFPVLLKASAGGGGKGMRVVRDKTKLREEIEMAKSEGKRSFGNDKLLIERYFENVKHIEVQIIGDQHGNVYHCFERECSMQRRHQKVIEETPSPLLSPTLRQQITSAAVAIGKSINYEGAGTVEFILDVNEQKFYFLEVNTRLQVEHPVTECITGLDLVELQIKVAEGHSLQPYGLDKLKINGHAIECRLYAEDAYNNFAPCSGQLRSWRPIPPTEGIRYDSGIITGSQISIFYDPMISKLITWAPTRELAIQRMAYTLLNTVSLGLTTNKAFLYELLTHNVFSDGTYTTRFIGDYLSNKKDTETKAGMTLVLPNIIPPKPEYIVTAGMLWFWYLRNQSRSIWKTVPSGYRNVFYRSQKDQFKNTETNEVYEMEYTYVGKIKVGGDKVVNADKDVHVFSVKKADGDEFKVEIVDGVVNRSRGGVVNGYLRLSFDGTQCTYEFANGDESGGLTGNQQLVFVHNNNLARQVKLERLSRFRSKASEESTDDAAYVAAMPCRILKVAVKSGQKVKANDLLITMESMKMETRVYAKQAGNVTIFVKDGDMIEAGTVMAEVK